MCLPTVIPTITTTPASHSLNQAINRIQCSTQTWFPFHSNPIPAITQSSSFIFRKFCFACRRGWLVLSVGNSFWNVYHVPITPNLNARYERKTLIIISEMGFNVNTMAWPELSCEDDGCVYMVWPFRQSRWFDIPAHLSSQPFHFAFEITAPELICICRLRH